MNDEEILLEYEKDPNHKVWFNFEILECLQKARADQTRKIIKIIQDRKQTIIEAKKAKKMNYLGFEADEYELDKLIEALAQLDTEDGK